MGVITTMRTQTCIGSPSDPRCGPIRPAVPVPLIPADRNAFCRAESRWNIARIYAAVFTVPFIVAALGFTWAVAVDTQRAALVAEATVLESSRPLGGDDKAPVDWTGDSRADGWAYGEYLPGDQVNVHVDSNGKTFTPLDTEDYAVYGVLGALALVVVFAVLALFIGEVVTDAAWRAANSDVAAAMRYQANPDAGRGRRWHPTRLICPHRLTAAVRRSTSPVRLMLLLLSPLPGVARAAAVNPSTPRWVRVLAVRQRRLRGAFIDDPRTSAHVLLSFATDPDTPSPHLEAIARHANVDGATLQAVARHRHVTGTACEVIAAHPGTPAGTVIMLATDPPEQFDAYQRERFRRAATRNGACPPEALAWLAEHVSDGYTLDNVAQHANTPSEAAVLAALRERGPGVLDDGLRWSPW